ncbi:L7Ae/L30e/S12e/Gadd45 family ribosomal protein [Cuneatibacter caecimuris]|uniref:Ribosomal protein L7Ae-like RNA K-turn-binding protein n=1 Tax=Cuneatibacter caecimuris TaxID=1796618 RepID=A0A4Q7NZE1_9FIRM|nr:ribosomal protein L7Ae-like RNA K-turn-binding protein [Cuneatibacter caecimuris]
MGQNSKALGLLGLAERAGKVASGEFSTEKMIRAGRARLVIVAETASDNTKKLFTDKCAYYKVPVVICFDKETLGRAIGKEMRASAAVLDEGFAQAVLKKLKDEQ